MPFVRPFSLPGVHFAFQNFIFAFHKPDLLSNLPSGSSFLTSSFLFSLSVVHFCLPLVYNAFWNFLGSLWCFRVFPAEEEMLDRPTTVWVTR